MPHPVQSIGFYNVVSCGENCELQFSLFKTRNLLASRLLMSRSGPSNTIKSEQYAAQHSRSRTWKRNCHYLQFL